MVCYKLLSGPRKRRLRQRVCYQLSWKRRLRQSIMTTDKTLGHWTLMGPGIRGRRLAMDDSERCYGRWLLNGPRERRPRPRLQACYLLSGPRERYRRQTLHPVHIRRSGPILQLVELRRGYSRRTDDALTEPRRASRTPSEYRASTETGTEECDEHHSRGTYC